jgi:16S rRNA processing protein RimM
MSRYIEAGRITSAHSFRGEVKIQSWCDTPEFLTRFEIFYLDPAGGGFLTMEKIRPAGSLLIASFAEIDSREKAFEYKNKVLYIKKEDAGLDEGTYFVEDMLGLPVFDFETGEKYGVLADVFDSGASDIYVVRTENLDKNNKPVEVMIPNVAAFVKRVSLDDGIFVTPIEGMF